MPVSVKTLQLFLCKGERLSITGRSQHEQHRHSSEFLRIIKFFSLAFTENNCRSLCAIVHSLGLLDLGCTRGIGLFPGAPSGTSAGGGSPSSSGCVPVHAGVGRTVGVCLLSCALPLLPFVYHIIKGCHEVFCSNCLQNCASCERCILRSPLFSK